MRSDELQMLKSFLTAPAQVGVDHIREGYVRHLDTFVYASKTGVSDFSKSRVYRPVNENFADHMPARTRAILTNKRGEDRPKTIYELLERHCDSLNGEILLIVDHQQCGVSIKLANFMRGYIRKHNAEVDLPQWGTCLSRGMIKRYFKSINVQLGDSKRELLVKTKSNVESGVERTCLVLYIDLRRPSQRWKVEKMCKYILREVKRTFKIDEDLPDVDADCVKVLPNWLQRISGLGDIVLVLDGVDVIDNSKEDNPLFFLPTQLPPSVRIILSCYPSSRLYLAMSAQHNDTECLIVRRKSVLTENKKIKVINGAAQGESREGDFGAHLPNLTLVSNATDAQRMALP